MQKTISTIKELHKEKEKLSASMQFTREALVESIGQNRKEAKRFFLENVLLPMSILGMGSVAIKQLIKKNENHNQQSKQRKFDFKPLLKKLFPIALNIFKAYIINKQEELIQQQDEELIPEQQAQPASINSKKETYLKSVS